MKEKPACGRRPLPDDGGREVKTETARNNTGTTRLLHFSDPAGIEAESMRQITAELDRMGVRMPEEELQVLRRVIHATADFDFAETMVFSGDAVRMGRKALFGGKPVITDTNMALAGISRVSCEKFGNTALCFMACPEIADKAKREGTTRAWAAMGYAAERFPDAVYAVGNAPTALLRLEELIRTASFFPSLVVAVPVGFVNVAESKERILAVCRERGIPVIAAMGRKGGSTVAAAVMNALFYGISSSGEDCK